MTYSIRSESGPEGSIVVLAGDVDLTAAHELHELLSTTAADGDTVIAIDLAGATLIDSRTIAVLVDWSERLLAAGGRMPVICDSPNILRLLKRIGLDRTLTIHPSREQALRGAD